MQLPPEQETWRDIAGFEGHYQASSIGRVRSVTRYVEIRDGRRRLIKGRILRPAKGPNGYLHFQASVSAKATTLSVHRAVAAAFVPNPLGLPLVNHVNGVKSDNRPENLEWCTSPTNIAHALDTGLRADFGEFSHYSKLTIDDVKQIKALRAQGMSYSKLASKFSVSVSNIRLIVKDITWQRALAADNDNTIMNGCANA